MPAPGPRAPLVETEAAPGGAQALAPASVPPTIPAQNSHGPAISWFSSAPPPIVSQTGLWYGAQSPQPWNMFGGPSTIARTPGAPGELHYTIIPLPVVPPEDVTIQRRRDAIQVSYQGRFQDGVDLYRLTVEADGWMVGILDTMARGILGLPLAWQGDEELVAALQDQDDTPGDFRRMHPMAETAKIFRDGLGLGLGLGQYLLMCWRCEGVEWDVTSAPPEPPTSDAAAANEPPEERHVETCRRCRALRTDRPLGQRELYQLRWRDARWLYRNPITNQWYYTGRQGMIPITPGDGEWFLFTTVPDTDIWRHGPWVWGTIAAIFARDSTYDRQNTSAVCAPTHVFKMVGSSDPHVRADIESQAQNLQFNNRIILPGEAEHRIDAAKAEFVDVTKSIVEWASDMWEVGLTGNQHGRVAGPGFSNMDVFARTTRDHRAFFAQTWIDQIIAQGLRWWARDNFGPGRVVPCGKIDVRSPEEKLAASKADAEEGAALEALVKGYAAVGADLDQAYIHERAQGKGHRIIWKAVASAIAGPAAENAQGLVMGGEGRAALGLQPFGDDRDMKTVAELLNQGKALGKAAPPAEARIEPPAPDVGRAPGMAEQAPPAARLEDEEDDNGETDEEDAARLAAQYTAAGLDRCPFHGRTHACPRCGVQRVYALDAKNLPRIAWRPIRAARARAVAPPIAPAHSEGARLGTGSATVREAVRRQLLEDFPPEAIAWIDQATWEGPEEVPLDRVDFSNKSTWAASHEPEQVEKFKRLISKGKRKPVILVKKPGDEKMKITDGHHRSLGYEALDQPLFAYVATVPRRDGPWDQMHASQERGPSGRPSGPMARTFARARASLGIGPIFRSR